MKKNITIANRSRRLVLSRETLRGLSLTAEMLEHAQGGLAYTTVSASVSNSISNSITAGPTDYCKTKRNC